MSMKRFILSTQLNPGQNLYIPECNEFEKKKKGNSNRLDFLAPALCTCVLQMNKKPSINNTQANQHSAKET